MNIIKLLITGAIMIGTFMSISTASFAGNPAAYSCLKDIARGHAYTNADLTIFCLRKKPVWRMHSWTNNGKLVKPLNPMAPTAFNSSELKMCGNPCN